MHLFPFKLLVSRLNQLTENQWNFLYFSPFLCKVRKYNTFENVFCSSMGRVKQKKCLQTCAKCADSHQPGHEQSRIRPFSPHWSILYYPVILLADREGPDQTARMRRLIWAFAVRICTKTRSKFRKLMVDRHIKLDTVWFSNFLTKLRRWGKCSILFSKTLKTFIINKTVFYSESGTICH